MPRINHDQNFKLVISEFFPEFMQLFFPSLHYRLDWSSMTFLDKEFYVDRKHRKANISDLIVRVKLCKTDSHMAILLESQSKNDSAFPSRMYNYYTRLEKKYSHPIYAIALLTFDSPLETHMPSHSINLAGFTFLQFKFKQVQLNKLIWQKHTNSLNPIAIAFMAKMRIDKKDRPKVRYLCIRSIARLKTKLKLPEEKLDVLGWFVEQYLNARNDWEEQEFQRLMKGMPKQKREVAMEMMTSWERKGREEGRKEGREEGLQEGCQKGMTSIVIGQLSRKFGDLDSHTKAEISSLSLVRLEQLGADLLEFDSLEHLDNWLRKKRTN